MAGGDADIWVCGQCRSVNKLRAKQCYHCRTPRDLAAVDPAAIEGTGHGQLREIALPEFHASRGEALLATILILVVAAIQVVVTVLQALLTNLLLGQLELLSDPAATVSPDLEASIVTTAAASLVSIGAGLLALTAWAFWLSRVVSAMPALGLGYPPTNALMAFIENFVPFLNLFRVPAIVRDVVRRLEPGVTEGQSRGDALIFAAWIGLIGGYFIPRMAGFLNLGADTLERQVGNGLLLQGVATGLVVVGAIFLVVLIWWIEARIAERRQEQLEGRAPAIPAAALATAVAAVAAAATEPRLSAPVEAAMPAAAMAAPFAPSRHIDPAPEPTEPAPPFVPTPGAPAAVAPVMVAGPLGAVPADPASADSLHRSITSVTGTASVVTPAAEASSGPGVVEPGPVPEALAHVPSGPRLGLLVEGGRSIIATLDGDSEPITLDELRAAAAALARADGSATITTSATTFEARALAQQALEILTDAHVPATLED